MESYNSIKAIGTSEYVDRKSRFLGFAKPVETEEAAKEFIDELKKKYHDARHACYAYRVGVEHEVIRYADDGEPQGTAGLPMVNILTGDELNVTNTVVVVIRYFGGTLLGTGGLVKAYGTAAKEAIVNAEVVTYKKYIPCDVVVAYGISGQMEYKIRENINVILKNILYGTDVTFQVLVPSNDIENFYTLVADISGGTAINKEHDVVWSF